MAPDIHPVAFIIYSSRDSADLIVSLENNRLDVCALHQFIGRCQTGRPCPDYYGCLLHGSIVSNIFGRGISNGTDVFEDFGAAKAKISVREE